jgi:peptide chain release factor 1
LHVEGNGTDSLDNEAGGHRIQRVPITERNGRVHSSTVTVAILGESYSGQNVYLQRSSGDYRIEWFSGTGCGGQFRNKHQNSARIIHIPTGVTRTAQTRSRENSLKSAMNAVNQELDRLSGQAAGQAENTVRKGQVGSGERSDKRRTLRFQDDIVIDRISGKRMSAAMYMKGHMDQLWGEKTA